MLSVLLFRWRRRKLHHVRQLKPATGDPHMPQNTRDAKTNGFTLVPEEVKSASKARNICDIITLDLSDSDD
eukprot:7019788-Ditylum_brightwellii.AAC.1